MPTLCIVAGGSGGHILPALTLAQSHNPSQIIFFSSTKAIDSTIAPHVTKIPLGLPALPSKKLWRYPAYLLALAAATVQAWRVLRMHRPAKIISTGGQLGIPVCLAGRLLNIPIEVYELNARPGRAMRVLGKLATKVYCVFDECKKFIPRSILVKYPVRFKSHSTPHPLDTTFSPECVCRTCIEGSGHAVEHGTQTLLILGGSQGSRELNELVRGWVAGKQVDVIHQVGAREDRGEWEAFYAAHNLNAEVFTYRENLEDTYQRARVAVARAGAGTIFELMHFNIEAVLVPLALAANHQVHNAQVIAKKHPALFTVLQPQPTQEQFNNALEHLLRDRNPH